MSERTPAQLLTWTREIVEINSGTQNRGGVLEVQRKVADSLGAVGFRTEWVENPGGPGQSGPLLLGHHGDPKDTPLVTLVSHADTVFEPTHEFREFRVEADGRTARGPGIIDDKGSITVGLEACRRFLERSRGGGLALRFVCSPAEEIGSPGWLPYFQRLSRESAVVIGLEPATEDGDFITKRKGGRWYLVQVEGKEAHAGRAHHLGVNAGHELAVKVDKLQRLTDYRRGSTVNLGSFEGGGGKFNVVCGHATGRIDVRYDTARTGRPLFGKIEKILKAKLTGKGARRAKTTFSIVDDCPPLEPQRAGDAWVRFHQATLAKLEKRRPRAGMSGGGSDSSYFSRPGLIVLDGMGACGGKIHSSEEFLIVDSLGTRAEALARLLDFAAGELT